MALLVLLFFFHLILDINSQYVPQPRLSVSPEVLTERGSVQIHCHVPDNVKVSQCYFYPERDDTNLKLSPSCQLSVIGSELIRWTGRSSPGTLHIICYYTVDNSVRTPSPHSLPAPVTVLNQKPRLSVSHDDQLDVFRFVCEISGSESVTADFSCNLYTGENAQPYVKTRSLKAVCSFTAEKNYLFNRLQSVKSREVSCDYSLISDPTARSLMSDKYNMIHFFNTTTTTTTTSQTSTPEEKPSTDLSLVTTPPSIATEKSTAVFSTPLITTRHTTSPEGTGVTQNHHNTTSAPNSESLTHNNLSSLPTRSSTTKRITDSALSTVSTSQTTPKDKSTASPVSISTVNTTSGPTTSERFNMTHQTDVPKTLSTVSTSQTTPKDKSTDSPVSISTVNITSGPTTRSVLVLLLSVTSVSVFLAGLMSVCLCRFIRKQMAERRKLDMICGDQEFMMSMLNMNTSGSEAAATYSVITAVPLPSLPLDTNADVKEDAKKTGDDVHHMYCTIADTQVVTKDKDNVYSLIQKH